MLVWIKSIFQVLGGLFQFLANKQLIDAGKAMEKADVDKAEAEAVAKTKEIVQEIDKLDNAGVDNVLQEWTRKD